MNQNFSVETKGNYILLKTWGQLDVDHLSAPVDAAIAEAQKSGATKILDDIREIDTSNLSLGMQTKSASILWKLKRFKKVAILFKNKEVGFLFFSMLQNLHLSGSFKGFDNEADAIAWVQED